MVFNQPPSAGGHFWPPPQQGQQYPPGYGAVPGYGQPALNFNAPGAPPRKPPFRAKRWYIVGGALFTVGVIAVALGLAGLIGGTAQALPRKEHIFSAGGMMVVPFDAGESRVVFGQTSATDHPVHCNVGTRAGSGHDASITNYDGGLSINGWDAIFTVTASQAGEYAVMCEGQPSDRFGVGGNARPTFVIGGVLSIIAGGFISVLGIGTVIVAAVVASRRRTI